MSFMTPETLGETWPISGNRFPASDSYVTDTAGNKQAYVHGWIVKSAIIDWPASDHFGEEILRWELGMATKAIMSTNGDTQFVEPIRPHNIKKLKTRFPEAFAEYIAKYGDDELPDAETSITGGRKMNMDANGNPVPYVPRVMKGVSIEEQKKELQRKLKLLEAAEAGMAHAPAEEDHPETVDYSLQGGHPMKELRGVPARAKEQLAAIGIVTIEGLANLTDFVIPDLGAGNWDRYRTLAREKLEDLAAREAAAA